MFCQNCGKKLDDDAEFCPYCGAPVEVEAPQNGVEEDHNKDGNNKSEDFSQHAQPEQSNNDSNSDTSYQNKKRTHSNSITFLRKKTKYIIGALLGVIVILCLISIFYKPVINMDDYVTISYEGYNTVGSAKAEFNYRKIASDNTGIESLSDAEDLLDDIGQNSQLDKQSELSNGDVVTYKWSISNSEKKQIERALHCKLKYKDIQQQVTGLKDAETYDPFESIEVTFDGVAPNGTASVNDNSGSWDISYEVSPSSGLSNGDTVTVYYSVNGYSSKENEKINEYCAENFGKIPTSTEKEYTVSGLSTYVQKLKDISDSEESTLESNATDIINAYIAKSYGNSNDKTFGDLKYIGRYLLCAKTQDGNTNPVNALDLVYKISVSLSDDYDGDSVEKTDVDYYCFVNFTDVKVNDDGEVTYDPDYVNVCGQYLSNNLYGYENLSSLYMDAVTANIDRYNHEDDVDEQADSSAKTAGKSTSDKESGNTDNRLSQDYIIPDSNSRLLTDADISGLSLQEINYAKNEIFARHGRRFKSSELQSYFDSKNWYSGTIDPDDFNDNLLSSTEKSNAEFLGKAEFAMDPKGYQLSE